MVAMKNNWEEHPTHAPDNVVEVDETVAPVRVPPQPLPAPGRKMSFQEAMQTSIAENQELLERLA